MMTEAETPALLIRRLLMSGTILPQPTTGKSSSVTSMEYWRMSGAMRERCRKTQLQLPLDKGAEAGPTSTV
ncbi:hypothetical protein ES703_114121 [subsurface metagenome]